MKSWPIFEFRFLTLFRDLKKNLKKFSKPIFNFFLCFIYVRSWPFPKNKKLEKIANKLCANFQKYKTLGGQLNMVFGAKKKNFGPPENRDPREAYENWCTLIYIDLYIFICLYISLYIYIYLYISIYIYIYLYFYIYLYIYLYIKIYLYI